MTISKVLCRIIEKNYFKFEKLENKKNENFSFTFRNHLSNLRLSFKTIFDYTGCSISISKYEFRLNLLYEKITENRIEWLGERLLVSNNSFTFRLKLDTLYLILYASTAT